MVQLEDEELRADKVILATPFEQIAALMQPLAGAQQEWGLGRAALLDAAKHFVHAPFISILLWFERENYRPGSCLAAGHDDSVVLPQVAHPRVWAGARELCGAGDCGVAGRSCRRAGRRFWSRRLRSWRGFSRRRVQRGCARAVF